MSHLFPNEFSLIESKTASNSADISFTSGISSNFASYMVTIRNYVPSTDATDLRLELSTDGGSTYLGGTSYTYSLTYTTTGTLSTTGSTGTSFFLLCNSCSSSSANVVNGELILHGLPDSSSEKNIGSTGVYVTSGSAPRITILGASNSTTTAVNAIKFTSSSGNMASGVFSLYGIGG